MLEERENEEIWISPITNAPLPIEKPKTILMWQHKNATQLFTLEFKDYEPT